MRLLQGLAFLSLPLVAFAAKAKANVSTFDKYHAKAQASAPVVLDDSSFAELTAAPRDYGVVMCLTAMDAQFGCRICQDFAPEWNILAKSWANGDRDGESRTIYGTLDFLNGRSSFQALKLDTAPVVLYYPPTTGRNARSSASPIRYDFTSGASKAEQVHSWVSRQFVDDVVRPPVRRPFNYVKTLMIVIGGLGAITAVTTLYPYMMPVLHSRNTWAVGCVVAILLFTSGHMYNHIRGVPYVASNGKGGIEYFANGFQNQYGMESQIVGALYAILAFATVFITLKVPRMENPTSQKTALLLWAGIMYGTYSFLMSVFRKKNAGYPYGLPPF